MRSETVEARHRCKKAVGSRANGALLRCAKPGTHTIRGERGRIIAWLCRKHHEAWTKYIAGLLANRIPGYRRTK